MTRTDQWIARIHPAVSPDPLLERGMTLAPSDNGAILVADAWIDLVDQFGTHTRYVLEDYVTLTALASALPAWVGAAADAGYASRGAISLAPMREAQALIAGGELALSVYTSALWCLVRPLLAALARVSEDTRTTTQQTNIHLATGRWLDAWGAIWGVVRRDGETDEQYRVRMATVITSPRASGPALEALILSVFGIEAIVTDGVGGSVIVLDDETNSEWGPDGIGVLGPSIFGGFVVTLPSEVDDATLARITATIQDHKAAGIGFTVITGAAYTFALTYADVTAEVDL